MFNSFWFSLASMLCQGADNTPKSLSGSNDYVNNSIDDDDCDDDNIGDDDSENDNDNHKTITSNTSYFQGVCWLDVSGFVF